MTHYNHLCSLVKNFLELWGTQAGREMLTAYVRGRNLVWSGHLTKEKLQEQGVRDLLLVNPTDGYYSG